VRQQSGTRLLPFSGAADLPARKRGKKRALGCETRAPPIRPPNSRWHGQGSHKCTLLRFSGTCRVPPSSGTPASPAGYSLASEPVDRVLTNNELASVIRAARQIDGAYGGIVEMLALTGQRREEVAQMVWDEIDFNSRTWTLPGSRTKNGKPHIVHLSEACIKLIKRASRSGSYVFSISGARPFQNFTNAKRVLDELSGVTGWRLHDLRRTCVSGMARLGVPPHVADKILNHQSGTISGVAAVYQRHDFLAERKLALERWGLYIETLVGELRLPGEIAAA
jgi:integrase